MSLLARLAAIVDGMPAGSAVSLPVDWLRRLLEAEAERKELGRHLTLEEAAEAVQRAVSTVRTWCNTGTLEGAYKLNGRDWRVPEEALRRYLESQAAEARPVSPGAVAGLGAWRGINTRRDMA